MSATPAGGGEVAWLEAKFGVPAEPVQTDPPSSYDPVNMPAISIDGPAYSENGVQVLTGSSAIFTWMTTGDVQGHFWYWVSSSGEESEMQKTTSTSMTVDLTAMAPGTYRLYVGAVPVGASSMDEVIWNSVVFGIPGEDQEGDF